MNYPKFYANVRKIMKQIEVHLTDNYGKDYPWYSVLEGFYRKWPTLTEETKQMIQDTLKIKIDW